MKTNTIVRLTNHLNEVCEDPFNFEFDQEDHIEEVATNSGTGTGGPSATASVSDLNSCISAVGSTTTALTTLTTTARPFVNSVSVSSKSGMPGGNCCP